MLDPSVKCFGHHDSFGGRGCPIPKCFQGFNVPERSKHRKRSLGNMSADILETLASKLFRVLQAPYLQRKEWGGMKESCDSLAHSLQKYACELRGKNKTMRLIHSSLVPWRCIQNGLDLFYLKPISTPASELGEISKLVKESEPYSLIDLHSYLHAS